MPKKCHFVSPNLVRHLFDKDASCPRTGQAAILDLQDQLGGPPVCFMVPARKLYCLRSSPSFCLFVLGGPVHILDIFHMWSKPHFLSTTAFCAYIWRVSTVIFVHYILSSHTSSIMKWIVLAQSLLCDIFYA